MDGTDSVGRVLRHRVGVCHWTQGRPVDLYLPRNVWFQVARDVVEPEVAVPLMPGT